MGNLGDVIRRKRESRGDTQGQVGDVVGVNSQAVSNWERGVRVPKLRHLLALARYFGCSIATFTDGDEKQTA